MKKWTLKAGLIASILGVIGITACCVPVMGILFGALGISVLFLHKISVWFVIVGIIFIVMGAYFGIKTKQ